jgi:hypothetical protein
LWSGGINVAAFAAQHSVLRCTMTVLEAHHIFSSC